jgi:hypothetical protein
MLDSLHLARWVSQFSGTDVVISVFPSSRFRKVHPKLLHLTNDLPVSIVSSLPKKLSPLMGYLDYFLYESIFKSLIRTSRAKKLKTIINDAPFDYVHLIEIQHAGYLFLDLNLDKVNGRKTILTNLGSDIYFFAQFPEHKRRIKELLDSVDAYSAECSRDYILAKELGFSGINLPLVPNAGGFEETVFSQSKTPVNLRSEIFLKGYGGRFGLPDLIIATIKKFLNEYPVFSLNIVSVTEDVLPMIKELNAAYPNRIKYWTVRKPISHQEVLDTLARSLLYFGFSKSDGISTTFLEALIMGAYPIQTNTSCANEWISQGFIASSVADDFSQISTLVDELMQDPDHMISASKNNQDLSRKLLAEPHVRKSSVLFYV